MKNFESLQLYLPSVVAKAVAESKRNADGTWRPEPREMLTVCLFADVSKFTSMTEILCKFGPSGLEDLSNNLNKFATQLVKLTTRAGGDVIKFAGDAMLALWPEVDARDPRDFELRVQRAVQCAVDIQLQLDNFRFSVYEKDTEYKDIEQNGRGEDAAIYKGMLRAKLGLGAGKVRILHLGGNGDLIQRERFEYVAMGPALMEAIDSESHAEPGDVVVSPRIWQMVGKHFTIKQPPAPTRGSKHGGSGKGHSKGSSHGKGGKGSRSGGSKGSRGAAARSPGRNEFVKVGGWKNEHRVPWRSFDRAIPNNDETERKLWKYVPNAVMPYLVETNDEFWAPELRTVTTLFFDLGLNIPELTSGQHGYKLEQVFYEIQGILLGYEGTINKFLVDDKGSTLIAVFGLPPFAHENDPLRGILSALKILWMLSKYKLQGSVGISTGLAFCGIIGHAVGNRREYSVIGDTVNLAARLLSSAKKTSSNILIDRTTRSRTNDTVLQFIQQEVVLKGKANPVECYQISGNIQRNSPTPDFHSVQMARLSELSRYNSVILDSQTRRRPSARRRTTKAAVTSPHDMKMIEELQRKAMNNTTGFMAQRKKAKARSGGAARHASEDSHDAALVAASNNLRAGQKLDADAPGAGAERPFTLAKIKYRCRTSTRQDDMDEVETAITLGDVTRTVQDLLGSAVHNLIKKGFIDQRYATELSYFELLWLRESERVTLKPSQKISALPRGTSEVMTLLLIRYDRRRNYSNGTDGASFQNTSDYVRQRLSSALDDAACGDGGRVVLLDGDHGVGKTRLVESLILTKEGAAFEDALLIGYARGNPFEAGRNASPFSVWEHLLHCLLDPDSSAGDSKHHHHAVGLSKEEQKIRDALEAAAELDPTDAPSMDDLHLLNKILLTQFMPENGPLPVQQQRSLANLHTEGEGSEDDRPASPTHGRATAGPTPVASRPPREKHGRKMRAKTFGGIFSGGSSDQLDVDGNGAPGASVGTAGPVPMGGVAAEGGARHNSVVGRPNGSSGRRRSSMRRLSATFASARASVMRVKGNDDKLSCDAESRTVINMFARILVGLSVKAPVVVIVDEAHFMDIFSWLVFQELADRWLKTSNVLVILLHRVIRVERSPAAPSKSATGRNTGRVSVFRHNNKNSNVKSHLRGRMSELEDVETSIFVHEALKNTPGVEHLELHPTVSDTKDIICNHAKVDRVPDELESFLRRKTKGNPLYITDAVQMFMDCGLVARHDGTEAELYFPNGEFERLLNVHALPIPLSVESIAASVIDRMSLTQQLIVKVAAIIGEVFTMGLVRSIFPLKSKVDEVKVEFDELVRSGFVVKMMKDQDMYLETKDPEKVQYRFESGWMVEIVRKRMLNKQKLKLNKEKKIVQRQWEKDFQKQFMMQAQDTLEVVFEGYLQVRKENARNMLKPWKPRWCVLKGNELVQYYDKDNPKRLEVIILNAQSSVRTEPVGFFGYEGHQAPPLCCFTIMTSRWEKKGRIRTDSREFTLACEAEEERIQWVYRVQYQLDLLKLRMEAGQTPAPEPEPRGSTASQNGPHVPDARSSPVAVAAPEQRPSVSTVASDASAAPKKHKLLKSVFGKRRKSITKGQHRTGSIEYGVALQLMSPEDFKAIRVPESLNILWSQSSRPDPHVVPPGIPSHSIDMWYETSEMSLVSRNSRNEIDGYLMGKMQNQRRTHIIGLITACAVLPQARRHGIGRRLYQKFFALCRGKGCRFVRVIIARDHSVAIAFHRALGFEEDEHSNSLLARADGEDRVCFIKDLDSSSREQEEEFIECLNPMHAPQGGNGAARDF